MSSIGPELPPHLQRGAEQLEDKCPSTVPSPATPPSLSQVPSRAPTPRDHIDDDDADYGPILPPNLLAARTAGPSRNISSQPHTRPVGPSLPTYAPANPDNDNPNDHGSDSDDDFGPQPLPPHMYHDKADAVIEFMEKEQNRRKDLEEASKPKALKREEWMLVPPSSSDLLAKLDPTKLKARQFSRSAAPVQGKVDNSLWTETPQERQQRLADEVSGKKRRAVEAQPVDTDAEIRRQKRRRDDDAIRKGVDDYTQKRRGPALISQHTSKQSGPEEKDNAIWDHSRDMSMGGRLMDDDKRNNMVKEAKGLGDRFGAGKSGGFL